MFYYLNFKLFVLMVTKEIEKRRVCLSNLRGRRRYQLFSDVLEKLLLISRTYLSVFIYVR